MIKLPHLQHQFQQYLLNDNSAFRDYVVNTGDVGRDTRLLIYKDAYQIRLVEALASNYPGIHLHLGENTFHQLAQQYIDSHPSHYRSIRWFGDQLKSHLMNHPLPDYPYLAEMAELEWNMANTFDAADADIVSLEHMANFAPDAWPNLVFTIHPSVNCMSFFWNVIPFWRSIIEETHAETAIKNHQASTWVLWRKDYDNRYYEASEDEAWALDYAMKSASFAEICEGLCNWHEPEEVGLRAAGLLKGWIVSGLISRINVTCSA